MLSWHCDTEWQGLLARIDKKNFRKSLQAFIKILLSLSKKDKLFHSFHNMEKERKEYYSHLQMNVIVCC